MARRLSASEANRRFFQLLGRAAAGEEFVITRRGEPVARLTPAAKADWAPDRAAALDRLLRLLDVSLGGGRFKRDELYGH